eukprot:GHVU01071217.1.p1 GENE.GHVU01071217.1~~GHVU01071217.1.p1  ORF type:complete len:109 (+),score=7.38 GHVU01071217.1:1960-2286(+)
MMDKGELVTSELINKIIKARIQEPDCANGFILDGYPRTLEQAQTVRKPTISSSVLLLLLTFVVIHCQLDYFERDKAMQRFHFRLLSDKWPRTLQRGVDMPPGRSRYST